jgi:hypothetical protein
MMAWLLLLYDIPLLLFYFEYGYPFFLGRAPRHGFLFFFWDNHISIFSFFSGILGERSHNTWIIYLVDEWSALIPSVGNLQWMWSVRDLDQESMKSISLGSQQFSKSQWNSIISMYVAYGSGRIFCIIEELVFPIYFENEDSRYHILLRKRL